MIVHLEWANTDFTHAGPASAMLQILVSWKKNFLISLFDERKNMPCLSFKEATLQRQDILAAAKPVYRSSQGPGV
jgi:hypothetical protein